MCWFFFSSRRRHTRCSRDWSSDVCSSDLEPPSVTFGPTKPSIDNRGIAKWLLPPPLPSAVLDQSTFTIVPLASASAWVLPLSTDDVELQDDTPKRRSALRMTFPTKGTTVGRGALGYMGRGS